MATDEEGKVVAGLGFSPYGITIGRKRCQIVCITAGPVLLFPAPTPPDRVRVKGVTTICVSLHFPWLLSFAHVDEFPMF